MKKFWLTLSVIWLWTCSGGGDKTTGPEEPPIVVNLTSLGGQAQKGPFNNGTAINVAELTNTLSPTGRNFSSAITDNTGRFSVANVQLESPYVELRANGYYFNEVSNEISSGQLTLFALSNLTGKTSLNVNILTHLEKNRMVALMSGDNPKTFAQAKIQAQDEVFAIFDYSRANVPESELLDISQSGAANAKLLAISSILQGNLTVGQMSQLLANISTDIAVDGTLDDTNLRNTLIENSKNLNMDQIRSNLESHYSSLGISATIPDFETEINQFLKPPAVENINLSIDEDTSISITLSGSDPEGESITFSIVDDTDNATLTLNGNTVLYEPNEHYNGTDIFTYKANDGTSDSNIATVTIIVNAVDDDPNTNDVAVSTDEDNAVEISLTADEYDGQNYSFNIASEPAHGTVSLDGDIATYTPNQDWYGTDTFTFEATDDRIIFGNRNVATATITVNPINDAPISNDVNQSANEDNSLEIALSASDVDEDNLTYSIVSDVSNGTTSISGSVLTYIPSEHWHGTDSFTYKVNDGTLDSNISNGTITIVSVNDPPIATDMTVSTDETKFISLDITLDVTDADGDALTYAIESNPSNGTTTLNGGIVTYVPTTDWNGEDSFTFKANDGTVDSNIATAIITVNSVDDAPVVVDSTFVIDEDQVIDIVLSATDVDDEDLFTWAGYTDPSNGTIVILDPNSSASASKTYRYTPNTNYNGTDSFKYYATNQNAQMSNIGTISFTINPVNDGPIANNLTMTVDEDWTGATVIIKGDNNGATDPESDAITYYVVDAPSNGSIYNDAGGGIPDGDALEAGDELTSYYTIYNPNENYNGTDTFTFKGSDGTLDGNTATVSITVNPINDAPTAVALNKIMDEDGGTIDVETNYNDVDGDTDITFTLVNAPSNGTATVGIPGTYTPNANFHGTDTFTYTVSDAEYTSDPATVTITVNAVNDPPIATDMTVSTDETKFISLDITLDVTDADGDALTYAIESNPSNGTTTLNGGIVTYVPTTDWNGEDSFTFKANDGTVDSNIATAIITVNPVNDSPIATSATIDSLEEDFGTKVFLLSDYVNDIDDDNLEYTIISGPDNGSLVDSQQWSVSQFNYTPNQDFNGSDSFTFKVNDGEVDSNSATITIPIIPINDAPIAYDFSKEVDEDGEITFALRETSPGSNTGTNNEGGVYDPDIETGQDDDIVFIIDSQPSYGTAELITNNDIKYIPTRANFNGTDTFTYRGNDGALDSNNATITIIINEVNDAPIAADTTVVTNEDSEVSFALVAHDNDGDELTYSIVDNPSNGSVSLSNETLEISSANTSGSNSSAQIKFSVPVGDGEIMLQFEYGLSGWSRSSTSIGEWNQYGYDWQAYTNQILEILDDYPWVNTYGAFAGLFNGFTSLSIGSITYTPTEDYNGTDTFTFKANDGTVDSNTSTVTITVAAVNDAPVVEDISSDVLYDQYGRTTAITLVGADDEDSNPTFTIVDQPSNGTITIQQNIATFTPNASGLDSFTYRATDDDGAASNVGTVTLNIIEDTSKTYHNDRWTFGHDIETTSDGGFILAGEDRSIGGGDGDASNYLVKIDVDGNIEWTVDKSDENSSFGDGYINKIEETDDGGFVFVGWEDYRDAFISKVDASGNVVWSKEYGESGNSRRDNFSSVKQTSDGGFIIAGEFQTGAQQHSDAWLVKTNSNGDEEWSKTYGWGSGPVGQEQFRDIQITSDGGFILIGTTNSVGAGGRDIYMVKVDSSGNEEWYKTIGGVNDESVLTGTFHQTTDGGYIFGGGDGNNGMYVVKTDELGNVEWDQVFNYSHVESIQSIQLAPDGGYYLTGWSNSFSTGNNNDIYIIKIDSSGSEEWSKTYGGDQKDDVAYDAVLGPNDKLYALGWTRSFGPTTSYNMYLIKVDSQGNQEF